MGGGQIIRESAPEPQPPPPPYTPKLTKEINSTQLLCHITNNTAVIQLFGPTLLKTLNMPKKGKLQRVEASWIESTTGGGPARIDYGQTWIDVFFLRGNQPSVVFFSGYLVNAVDLSWNGDVDFDENDQIAAFTSNVNGVADFNVNVILTYVVEVLV